MRHFSLTFPIENADQFNLVKQMLGQNPDYTCYDMTETFEEFENLYVEIYGITQQDIKRILKCYEEDNKD